MLKIIDADEKYLSEYKEAYIMSLEKINDKLMKKHDLMFMNPDEMFLTRRYWIKK